MTTTTKLSALEKATARYWAVSRAWHNPKEPSMTFCAATRNLREAFNNTGPQRLVHHKAHELMVDIIDETNEAEWEARG